MSDLLSDPFFSATPPQAVAQNGTPSRSPYCDAQTPVATQRTPPRGSAHEPGFLTPNRGARSKCCATLHRTKCKLTYFTVLLRRDAAPYSTTALDIQHQCITEGNAVLWICWVPRYRHDYGAWVHNQPCFHWSCFPVHGIFNIGRRLSK